jgi:hypothetical protein
VPALCACLSVSSPHAAAPIVLRASARLGEVGGRRRCVCVGGLRWASWGDAWTVTTPSASYGDTALTEREREREREERERERRERERERERERVREGESEKESERERERERVRER